MGIPKCRIAPFGNGMAHEYMTDYHRANNRRIWATAMQVLHNTTFEPTGLCLLFLKCTEVINMNTNLKYEVCKSTSIAQWFLFCTLPSGPLTLQTKKNYKDYMKLSFKI